jgi:hypothetical protein
MTAGSAAAACGTAGGAMVSAPAAEVPEAGLVGAAWSCMDAGLRGSAGEPGLRVAAGARGRAGEAVRRVEAARREEAELHVGRVAGTTSGRANSGLGLQASTILMTAKVHSIKFWSLAMSVEKGKARTGIGGGLEFPPAEGPNTRLRDVHTIVRALSLGRFSASRHVDLRIEN